MILIPALILCIYIIVFLRIIFLEKSSPVFGEESNLSVVIAAKNESENLPSLIRSLSSQNYPEKKYEVVIVDDNSDDGTFVHCEKLISGYKNFSILKAGEKKYQGKRGALQKGIENAKYENIVVTDADCEHGHEFLISFSNKFSEGFDFVFGAAPIYQNNKFVNKLACFDNLWVHILTFSFAAAGLPYSASARSLGFSKRAFEQVNGYRNTLQTLSGDDDLLLREARKNNLKISTFLNNNGFAYTESKTDLKALIKQRSRHTSSSYHYSFNVKLILGIWHLLNTMMLFSVIMSFVFPVFLYLSLIKIISGTFITQALMKTFGYRFSFLESIYLQIPYEVLIVINFISGFYSKQKW
jgi:cellulose synthase/poly-beta-1,6-N-acetylglucosamine synthase-like glycosyltransferase